MKRHLYAHKCPVCASDLQIEITLPAKGHSCGICANPIKRGRYCSGKCRMAAMRANHRRLAEEKQGRSLNTLDLHTVMP